MGSVSIAGTGSFLPEIVFTNADMEVMVDTTDEWITTRTGIKERRICPKNMASSDLAYNASISACKDAGISVKDLEIWASTKIKNGHYNLEGCHPVNDTNISIQGMNADNSLRNSLIIAQKLKVEIKVRFKYGSNSNYANQEGVIHWKP